MGGMQGFSWTLTSHNPYQNESSQRWFDMSYSVFVEYENHVKFYGRCAVLTHESMEYKKGVNTANMWEEGDRGNKNTSN